MKQMSLSPRPCLSVVIPCYNEESTVASVVDKVLANPWVAEVIVVDDGSTDKSREILASIDEPRLVVVVQPVNQGKGAALRAGFSKATAENRFGFEPEITAKVARGGWRVYEVGISYSGRTYAEGKKIGWRDGVRAMVCIVKYSRLGARLG